MWAIAVGAAAVALIAGAAWFLWPSRNPGTSGPDEAFLQSSLAKQLPAHVKPTALAIESTENTGTSDEPAFSSRFKTTLVLTLDTFVQSSVEGDVVFLAPRLEEGTVREVKGVATSKSSAANWDTELTFDNPISDLGHPREFFQAARVIVTGSPEEVAFRDEQRRNAELEAQAAQDRLREEELAQQVRAGEVRRQTDRIRAEAELEAQHQRAEAARRIEPASREAEARRAEQEIEAQRAREEAKHAAQEAADRDRRQAQEALRRTQAEESARFVEVPARTEFNVRLTSNLNSGTAKVEDRFEATTVQDLRINGLTIVPAGSVLRGIIATVQPATRTNRTAKMTLNFDQLTVNERRYSIRGIVTQTISGPGIKGEVARTAAGAGIGAIIGGILGGEKGAAIGAAVGGGGTVAATEGKEVDLSAGTVLRVRIESAVQIY